MTSFSLEMPGAIHFGAGSLARLSAVARSRGRRVLLVTGKASFDASAQLAGLGEALAASATERWSCPPDEPTEQSVDDAARHAGSFRPDVIVAVGGGSVLDTAKAVSFLALHPAPCRAFLEGTDGMLPVTGKGIPWVALPTTAGTGSEVTKNAVIRSESVGAKRSMRSPSLLAEAVIVDPDLAVTLPLSLTGASGLDALTQLVEAYVTRASNPLVDALVEGAFPAMVAALEGLPLRPRDVELRSKAAYGAMVSGVALANAGLGAAHGFAAAVGAAGVPHGLACAVFLPAVLEANAPLISTKLQRLRAACPGASGPADPVEWLSGKVRGFLAAFGLPADLRSYGIPAGRIAELAEKAMGSSMRGNPRPLDLEERKAILQSVL